MNDFNKTRWVTDGDEIRLGMEFTKVDKQRRMVAGWATLDNVDTENDVVTAEASIDAFSRSRGNLREMHRKDSAVGRIVSFKEDTFRAPDGKVYRGVFVKVRVSEGAQDTWLKVLDGTLSGFSIGGHIVESEEVFSKDANANIRKVIKYDLNELSLVDNPGNQYSDITNVFKFKKSADGSVTTLSGMIEEQAILNVFYCDEHKITKESPADSLVCPVDDGTMNVIGFVEDGSDRSKKVSTLVTKYLNGEGGVTMAKTNKNIDETDETVETGHVEGDPTEVPTPAKTEEEAAEVDEVEAPAEDVEEVQDEEEEISKKIDSLKTDISDILSKNNKDTAEKIDALEKTIQAIGEDFNNKAAAFEKKLADLDTNLDTAKSRLSDFEKSLNKINSNGAFRKSADLDDESAETVQKSDTWNGAFSVNNLLR